MQLRLALNSLIFLLPSLKYWEPPMDEPPLPALVVLLLVFVLFLRWVGKIIGYLRLVSTGIQACITLPGWNYVLEYLVFSYSSN